jgi:hypothetical protein
MHLMASAAPALTIVSVSSDVPSFVTDNGGSTDPFATADGNKSSDPGFFVEWANDGAAGFLIARFSYEFDAAYDVLAFELWNDRGQIDTGIEDFQLVFRDPTNSILGTFNDTASLPISTAATPQGERFLFTPFQNVKTVDLRVLSSFGVMTNQFREVEFASVPEPAALLLALLGLLCLQVSRRRQANDVGTCNGSEN